MAAQKSAALPLLLPLMDHKNKPVGDAHRLVYVNALIIYYSYQHPIAFLSKDKLFVRSDFWERRRGKRMIHIKYILQDVDRHPGNKDTVISKEFFENLQRELTGMNALIMTSPKVDIETKQAPLLRRVRL